MRTSAGAPPLVRSLTRFDDALMFVRAGVCLGMQLAVCEFARNELGWEGDLRTLALFVTGSRDPA